MPNRLPAHQTPVSAQDMFTALGTAWAHYFNSRPTNEQLCILLAQWAFETGWGHSMWNYNIGNAKSVDGDGRDYTFFACYELLRLEVAQEIAARAPDGQVSIKSVTGNTATTWFYPNHPACRFRAFQTLALGALDYLDLISTRFGDPDQQKNAWHWVVQADPVAFCHALKLKGYYTDDESHYAAKVKAVYDELVRKHYDMSLIPTFTDTEQAQLRDWTLSGVQEGIQVLMSGGDNGEPSA